jgi:sterol desaturase/sphingolipid hydroxylase (fatty acid hydroxylase superfamily)
MSDAPLPGFAFERRNEPLLPRVRFLARLARSVSIAVVFVAVSLVVGMTGYHVLEGLSWIDSFLNAAMLLGGMGPVDNPQTFGGKLFAGLYALYCGLVVIVSAGIILAPLAHRILHRFHAEGREKGEEQ